MDGGADAIHFTADGDTINFVTFYDPQQGWIGDPGNGQQYVDYTELNGGSVAEVAFYGPLWENINADANLPPGTRMHNLQRVASEVDLGAFDLFRRGDTVVTSGGLQAPLVQAKNRFELRPDGEQGRSIAYKHNDGETNITTINFTKYNTDIIDNRGGNALSYQAEDGTVRWTSKPDGGMTVQEQDLSKLSLGSEDDGDLYRHNGSNSISADGGTTSSAGWYAWDNSAGEFKSVVKF
jgi:hypothetical protein